MAIAKGVVAASTRYISLIGLLLSSSGIGRGGVGEAGASIVKVSGVFWLEKGNATLVLMTEKKVREWDDDVSDAMVVMVFVSLIEEIVAHDGVGEDGERWEQRLKCPMVTAGW